MDRVLWNLPGLGLVVSLQRDEPRPLGLARARGRHIGRACGRAAGFGAPLLPTRPLLCSARLRGTTRAICRADLQQQRALCLLRSAWRATPVFAQPSLPRLARCVTGWPQAKDDSCHPQPFGLRPTPFLLCSTPFHNTQHSQHLAHVRPRYPPLPSSLSCRRHRSCAAAVVVWS